MSRRSSRRRSAQFHDDLRQFRRDDSAFDEPTFRRQYQWPGEDIVVSSRRSLPRPFVKSVDYETDGFIAPPEVSPVSPLAGVPRGAGGGVSARPVRVSHGPSGLSLMSLLRGYFRGSDNPCVQRSQRREVIFAMGAGGRRLGTKKVRRTLDSERSC